MHEHGPGKRWDGKRYTCSMERAPAPHWWDSLLTSTIATAGTTDLRGIYFDLTNTLG